MNDIASNHTEEEVSLTGYLPPGPKQMARSAYAVMQLLADSEAYAKSRELRAHNEMTERIKFYLVHDVNTSHKIHDTLDNFTPEERERWFGKRANITLDDITWERVTALLKPAEVRNAVSRVNEALAGSHINNRFSRTNLERKEEEIPGSADVVYTPRTVTVYPSEEQAVAAAKFLNMLVNGSHAIVVAEPIKDGRAKPTWVVSDNMSFHTHKAIRLLLNTLFRNLPPEEQERLQKREQAEVDKRLPKGEQWKISGGANAYATLHGRPNVKMYKRDEHGRDDHEDMELLNSVPHQPTPRLVEGVPHTTTIRSDGTPVIVDFDKKQEVAYLIFGRKLADAIHHRRWDHLKEVITQPIKEFAKGSTEDRSAYGFIRGGTYQTICIALDFVHVNTANAIGTALGLGVSGTAYIGAMITSGLLEYTPTYKRWLLSDGLREALEKFTGPLKNDEAKFGKKWASRAPAAGVNHALTESFATSLKQARYGNVPPNGPDDRLKLDTPYGEVSLPDRALPQEKEGNEEFKLVEMDTTSAERNHFTTRFAQFMKDRWGPLPAHDKHTQHDAFLSARNELAESFADFILLMDKSARSKVIIRVEPSQEAEKEQIRVLDRMQRAATHFVDIMHDGTLHELNSQAAITMLEQTRSEMVEGLNSYMEKELARFNRARR